MSRGRIAAAALAWAALAMCAGCSQAPTTGGRFPDVADEPAAPVPAVYTCHRTVDPIRIDGVLSETSWQRAPSTGNFRLAAEGKAGPRLTRARMLWDDRMLYVAFECADRDIYTTLTGRDAALYDQDVVEVFIAEQTRGKGHFLEYEFSPRGAMFDAYVVAPYRGKLDWNSAGLAAAGKVFGTPNAPGDTDAGYVVEAAIPLDGLFADAFRPKIKAGQKIRLNLYRIDYVTPPAKGRPPAKCVYLAWSVLGENAFHRPEKFGTVVFSTDPPNGKAAPSSRAVDRPPANR